MYFILLVQPLQLNYTEHPVNTLKAGSVGIINTLGLAKKHFIWSFFLLPLEVYGDPLEHHRLKNIGEMFLDNGKEDLS